MRLVQRARQKDAILKEGGKTHAHTHTHIHKTRGEREKKREEEDKLDKRYDFKAVSEEEL